MLDNSYTPPPIWQWEEKEDNRFAAINRPTSGATHEKDLPVGKHPLQLYSVATPNGVKVTIMLEELLAAGFEQAEYDAWLINIFEGDQFGSGFTDINPNSKIPAMVDHSGDSPVRIFESGAILIYLAEKFDAFLPHELPARTECLSWLMWQMGATPFLGGGFGHFYAYADEKQQYPINRFSLEVKRQLDVLDKHLANNEYICGDKYTIADMAIFPWYGGLALGKLYNAAEFLQVQSYENLQRWTQHVHSRQAVQRGMRVNNTWGEESQNVPERHSASDLD